MLFFLASLSLRIAPQLKNVFVAGETRFAGADSYYHMRLVDNVIPNYPARIRFDPYIAWPDGLSEMRVRAWPPLFDILLGGIIILFCGTTPVQQCADMIAAVIPPVLGALTIIPVYFIGVRLSGKICGLAAAAILAIMPGGFLGRSLLGFTDHHALEALLSACTALFLVKALQLARGAFPKTSKMVATSLIAGVFLGLYLLTWLGAVIFFAISTIHITIEALIDNRRESFTPHTYAVTSIALGTALCLARFTLPFDYGGPVYWTLLAAASIWPIALNLCLRATRPFPNARRIFPALPAVMCFFLIFMLKNNTTAWNMLHTDINAMLELHEGILEAQPLLSGSGIQPLAQAWTTFGASFFIAPFGFVLSGYLASRRDLAEYRWTLVWCAVFLVLTLAARRFAYYYAINAALLTAMAIQWLAAHHTLFRYLYKTRIRQSCMAAILILAILPDVARSVRQAAQGGFIPDKDWLQAAAWLRHNTPEPFPDPDFYYQRYEPPPPGRPFDYPDSAYGIMNWWDYGHWIVREARRIPVSTPFQWGRERAARFFVANNAADAAWMMNATKSRYVIIDSEMITDKFYYIAKAARTKPEIFYEKFGLLLDDGGFEKVIVFYPEYYRSIAVRLYVFHGSAVMPEKTHVIKILPEPHRAARKTRLIEKILDFPDFETALDFIAAQKHEEYRIAGFSPFNTPVPLNALEEYNPAWKSDSEKVKIFEFSPNSAD